ncbi:hypothetical protein LTR85_006838 [Meristemomyces frigidus]|nr:hypothetical protein LTR85_006838 [Meristemomyces frigidus]
MFSTLPPETHLNIFSHLSPADLIRLQQTTAYFDHLIRTHEKELLKPFNGRWAHNHNRRLWIADNAANIRNLDFLDALRRWSRYFDLYSRTRSSRFADAEYELGVFVKHHRAMNPGSGNVLSWPSDGSMKAFAWLLFKMQSTLERTSDSSPELRWQACEEQLVRFWAEYRSGTMRDGSTVTALVTRVFEHMPFGRGAYVDRWDAAGWAVAQLASLPSMPGNARGPCMWRERSGSGRSATLELPRRYESLGYKIACPYVHELLMKEYEFVKEVTKAPKSHDRPTHQGRPRDQLRFWGPIDQEVLEQEIAADRRAYLEAYPAPESLLMAAVLEQTLLWVPSQI